MQENNNQGGSIPNCCGEMPSDRLQWIVELASIEENKQNSKDWPKKSAGWQDVLNPALEGMSGFSVMEATSVL